MTGRSRRIGVETAYRRITHRQIRSRYARIEGDAENRTVRQNDVVASHIYPVRLRRDAGPEIESNLNVTIVGADNRHALILGRIFDLVNKGAISERTFTKIRT